MTFQIHQTSTLEPVKQFRPRRSLLLSLASRYPSARTYPLPPPRTSLANRCHAEGRCRHWRLQTSSASRCPVVRMYQLPQPLYAIRGLSDVLFDSTKGQIHTSSKGRATTAQARARRATVNFILRATVDENSWYGGIFTSLFYTRQHVLIYSLDITLKLAVCMIWKPALQYLRSYWYQKTRQLVVYMRI